MKYQVAIMALLCGVLLRQIVDVNCKRSGGRSRGSSGRGSSSLWSSNNKKKSGSESASAPAKPQVRPDELGWSFPKQSGNLPKASAPKPEVQKVQKPVTTVQAQNPNPIGFDNVNKPVAFGAPARNGQEGTQQRPIGWNVPNQQNQGQAQTKTLANQQQSVAYPNNGYGTGSQTSHTNYGQGGYSAQGGYGQSGYGQLGYGQPGQPAYGQTAAIAGAGAGYGQPVYGNYYSSGQASSNGPTYNPQQPFPGYYPTSNIGVIPPRGANAGQYYNQMAGIPNSPSFGTHGNPNSGGGIFGSLFGSRSNSGYGYGGYGGMGSFGGYGGMMGPKRSFGSGFARTAFTSIATGLLVWSLMRGGRSHYYNVYNHYNHPEVVPQEITLPANVITLCPENVTLLCAPNTVPLCTANETILCAVSAAATIPCVSDAVGSCVDTTIPCTADCGEGKENTTLALPCIANATVNGQVKLESGEAADMTMTLFKQTPQNQDTVLCVTTMAMPSPEEENAANEAMQAIATTLAPPMSNTNNATNEQSLALPTPFS